MKNNTPTISKLFDSESPLYAAECMRVFVLNRKRARGHAGRILLAHDLKIRRAILTTKRS